MIARGRRASGYASQHHESGEGGNSVAFTAHGTTEQPTWTKRQRTIQGSCCFLWRRLRNRQAVPANVTTTLDRALHQTKHKSELETHILEVLDVLPVVRPHALGVALGGEGVHYAVHGLGAGGGGLELLL